MRFAQSISLFFGLCLLGDAQTVQNAWLNPAPPDFTDTWTNGMSYEIAWDDTLWQNFAGYEPQADVSNVDLWCMGFDIHQYVQLVSTQIAVNRTLSQTWKVNVSDDELSQTSKWVFRFVPHGTAASDINLSGGTVSSPGFYIEQPAAASTSTSETSTSSSSTSVDSSSSPTATSGAATVQPSSYGPTETPSSSVSRQSTTTGLSTGAKAGIGVGAALGGLALLLMGFLVARRYGRSPKNSATTPTNNMDPPSYIRTQEGFHGYGAATAFKSELKDNTNVQRPVELAT